MYKTSITRVFLYRLRKIIFSCCAIEASPETLKETFLPGKLKVL